MTGQRSERPDKGKGVARPKKRQRQAPNTPFYYPYNRPSSSYCDYNPHSPPVVITPTPLPDPTSIPSSSSIPPSETVTPFADPDSSGDGEGLDPPLHDRPWIEPYVKGIASQAITLSIKQQFLSPWPTWGAIPDDDRKSFWERFQAQALGRAVHVDEVFAQTHVRKDTNQFVDERSRKTHVRSEHESAPTPDDGSNVEDDIRGTLKHQPSSSTTAPDEVVLHLTQALQQHDQEITDLRVMVMV
ncbi:hypothetical protein LR48_Vigan11g093900 [Vigna angularis]|uniref:Uncharacterized protein n=1 Tax=Phaseolus angularis TaxID=3914 RepID=A0A0L9VS51_PHAAN|nr:hypothetical protein LR48_Vigan11g093900 [Vigna angularis]